MPYDGDLTQWASADRRAMRLIMHGEVLATTRLRYESGADKDVGVHDGVRVHIPQQVRAGEKKLRALGLAPLNESLTDRRGGLILLCSPTATRLTIVFNGNAPIFSLPRPLMTDVDTHILLIRDPSRCFGFLGIPDLGPDYESCVTNLQRIINVLTVSEVFCVGLSSGGSTALKFGCDLPISGMLGFSVPTTLDLNDDEGAELDRYPQLTRLYARARHLGIDLSRFYASHLPRPRVILVYSPGHARDAWLAGRMRGVDGVELLGTEEYTGHATYRWLQDNGRLGPFFRRLFELTPYNAADAARTS